VQELKWRHSSLMARDRLTLWVDGGSAAIASKMAMFD
jgi:hypothetical protein